MKTFSFNRMLACLLRPENQSRTAKTVEIFGWLILVEGPLFLLFPNFVVSALHLPPLVDSGANYFRLVGVLIGGLGMLYVVSARLNAEGFIFATLLDRPLVPPLMAVLWQFWHRSRAAGAGICPPGFRQLPLDAPRVAFRIPRARISFKDSYFMKPSIPILLTLLVVGFSFPARGQPGGVGGSPGYGGIGARSYSSAQADYKSVWQGFTVNTSSLLKTIGATNSEAALMLTQIQTNALFLEKKWNGWFFSHPQQGGYSAGDEYLASLRGDNRLLTQLKKEKDGQKALESLRDVALDLEIKAENCRHSLDGLGKEIKVKVHTKAGEKEIGGYEVYFVARGMLDVKSAHDRFGRQSSPTNEKILAPGRYAIWARRSGVSGEPITLRIGGHGETHFEVDIPVSAE